jgi:cyclic AMP-dependent transcription factor ATF-2
MQTRFEGDHPMYDANNGYSADGSLNSATYSTFGQWPSMADQASPDHMHHRMSINSEGDSGPYTTGRRRKSENVEPGSARAIYLEKNRKAASKCRTKQKKQQEDLVEAARDQERRNKVLKSEVEILKSDLRDLMELVGAHNECPDTRLKRYVQLEADRLAARGDQSPVADILSPKSSSRSSGSPP